MTPLGGAMNLVTVAYIEELTGTEFIYTDWVIPAAANEHSHNRGDAAGTAAD